MCWLCSRLFRDSTFAYPVLFFIALHCCFLIRAEAVLQRHRQQLAREKEQRRQKQAVRRTGGGFVIQYSKDV